MRILVLDSIHGGKVIADYLISSGHSVDMVDVYRHSEGISEKEAINKKYDLITAPVHLDPDYYLLRSISSPTISHHEIVRWILSESVKNTIIEITGKRGKTTTASALAFLMNGPGILQTSSGLIRYPEKEIIGRFSITPASLITANKKMQKDTWMIAEISLGFCGVGLLGILTSEEDYRVAGGKKTALAIKKDSSHLLSRIIVPPGVDLLHDGCIKAADLVHVVGKTALYRYEKIEGNFTNPLLMLPGYKIPLMLACAAALLLGIDPGPLSLFKALPGRMEVVEDSGYTIIDNSNSGTCYITSYDAYRYGIEIAGDVNITLIIGQESESVCDNFTTDEICSSIDIIKPGSVILIPGDKRINCNSISSICNDNGIGFSLAGSSDEALIQAKTLNNLLILLSVKRWK